MSGNGVALALAFALGVIVRDVAQDWRDQPAQVKAIPAPVPSVPRPAREPWLLTHPLNCDGLVVRACADWKPCRTACLPARVDDPRSLRFEPKGDLKHFPQRTSQPPLILGPRE